MSHMFRPRTGGCLPRKCWQPWRNPCCRTAARNMKQSIESAAEKAQQVFFTQYRVFIGTHSGSGMQETAIRNLVQSDVLCCVNGAFSERWYDVAVFQWQKCRQAGCRMGQSGYTRCAAGCA